VYCDGLDALGRPVVVVNADAVAEQRAARKAAFQYLLYQLEPIVVQVLWSCPASCSCNIFVKPFQWLSHFHL
jgi:hypothetical protein